MGNLCIEIVILVKRLASMYTRGNGSLGVKEQPRYTFDWFEYELPF
jgi:hypothetical protein